MSGRKYVTMTLSVPIVTEVGLSGQLSIDVMEFSVRAAYDPELLEQGDEANGFIRERILQALWRRLERKLDVAGVDYRDIDRDHAKVEWH